MTVSTAAPDDHLPKDLRCPRCAAGFRFTPSARQPLPGGTFGVLTCGTHEFPVVDGIPVFRTGHIDVQDHTTGRSEVPGPTGAELVDRVRTDPLAALVDLLAFPPALPFGLQDRPGLRLPLTRGPGARLLTLARRQLVRRMLAGLDGQCAQDWMDLCYLRSRNTNREIHPYFLNKFGQPRYLASLALTSVLGADDSPVLDLACGFGHLIHHLAVRSQPVHCVGVDRNFFQLWVARRFVAPGGHFVCADADQPLPFADDSFRASVCSDAFHLFADQEACLAELRRCSQDGTVVLDRIGNGLLEPHDVAHERDPAGYAALAAGTGWRMAGQTELVEGYLRGRGPRLAERRAADEFTGEKWLALVLSEDDRRFRDYGAFPRLPHGEGPLGLNPIYRVERNGAGVRLLFEFPSTWYAFENAETLSYTAAGVLVTDEEFAAIRAGRRVERTDELVARYVLLGMPERYARPVPTPP